MHAIDVHAHYGTYDHGNFTLADRFMSATIDEVRRRARAVDIRLSVLSPFQGLHPYEGDVLGANESTRELAEKHQDVRFWAVLDPRRRESYQQVARLLPHPRCKGIKLHPVNHHWDIRDYGEEIYEFAADQGALLITHSGCPGSFPEHYIPYADRFPQVRLILSHLGNSPDGIPSRQVLAIKRSQAGNVYVDTSSSRSLLPGLIEWAAEQIGVSRLLFGTDSPCYFAACQKARIEFADMDEGAKRAILLENAARLLNEEWLLEGREDVSGEA